MIRLYYCLLLMGSNSLYYARIYNINLGGKKNNMGAIEILLISIGLAMDAFAAQQLRCWFEGRHCNPVKREQNDKKQ